MARRWTTRIAGGRCVGIAVGCFTLGGAPALGQSCPELWDEASGPGIMVWPPNFVGGFDSLRRQWVSVERRATGNGSLRTWIFDGHRWRAAGVPGPSHRRDYVLAEDPIRHRIVLYGGRLPSNTPATETWEWDGAAWERVGVDGPAMMNGGAMAYDPVGGRMLLVVGESVSGQSVFRTWVREGGTWSTIGPLTVHPSGWYFPQAATDPIRQRIVLASNAPGLPVQEWDGAAWTLIEGREVEPWAGSFGVVFDPGRARVVMVGSPNVFPPESRVATWEGTRWLVDRPAGNPDGYNRLLMHDPIAPRLLVMTELSQDVAPLATWALDSERTWRRIAEGGPYRRERHAMAYDPVGRGVLLFGGYVLSWSSIDGETWRYDGLWSRVATEGPSARVDAAMAGDTSRGKVVLFGGNRQPSDRALLDDTWEWDGSAWTRVMPAGTSPSARSGHAMVYDAHRQEVVLFGGLGMIGPRLGDTWTWDGTSWTLRATSGPSPRMYAGMAYDAERQRVVLHGGDPAQDRGVWEWDGEAWSRVGESPFPGSIPIGFGYPAMMYDPGRRAVLSFGGTFFTAGTWAWDGRRWSLLGGTIPTLSRPEGAFDEFHGRAVLYGAPQDSVSDASRTWTSRADEGFRIVGMPRSQSMCVNRRIELRVEVEAATPVAYQWYHGFASPSSAIPGATGASIAIERPTSQDQGLYQCVVTNACGSVATATALLSVCRVDIDDGSMTGSCDGAVTIDDLLYYLVLFGAGEAGADVDDGVFSGRLDGGVTIDDLLYYLDRYSRGC